MSALDLLHRLIDEAYQEAFDAGYAAALGEAHRQGESDLDWEKVARHAEANPEKLSEWEENSPTPFYAACSTTCR